MDYIRDASELSRRIRILAFGGTADPEVADRLQRLPGVEADLICDGAEFLYANRDRLDESGLRLTGELYNHAIHQGWSTFNQDDRSARIVELIDRELGATGEGVADADAEWPEAQDDLRIKSRDEIA